MELILSNNYFTFNGTIYHQLRGTAMGSPVKVAYTSIFMFAVECNNLSRLIASSLLFKRYIDDLFAIIPSCNLNACIAEPVKTGSSVQFTNESSTSEVIILDLKLKMVDSAITSSFKSSNKFAYISPHSNRPRHTWSAVATGELIRAERGATDPTLATENRTFLKHKLLPRG